MPSRNIIKVNLDDTYHHVYSRGVNRMYMLASEKDKYVFESYLQRYLGEHNERKLNRQSYPSYRCTVSLIAYCLMDNHFHLLLHQASADEITKFMRALLNSYVRYYNETRGRSGPLFDSNYKASHISYEDYLVHVSKYIHRNPDNFMSYKHSSIREYLGVSSRDWISTGVFESRFGKMSTYIDYLQN